MVGLSRPARAEDVALPVPLQAEFLVKVAAYDRRLPERAGERVLVLVLVRPGVGDSERAANQLRARLSDVERIAGLPQKTELLELDDPAKIAAAVRARRPAILYVTPGFSDVAGALGAALDGIDVLTAGAVPSYVDQATALSFDVVSGKPKIQVHLTRSKRNQVSFTAAFLRLVRVVDR